MIREAIDRIQQLTHEAKRVEKAPDNYATGRYFVYGPDGDAQERFEVNPPRSTRHFSTESLARNTREDLVIDEADAAAYWNENSLNVELTTGVRVDDGTYALRWNHDVALPKHPAFAAVTRLTTTRQYTQKELIKFLRADLNGHVDDAIVEQFRSLKLSTLGGTDSVVAKGRESVDKRIQQQIRQSAGSDIPDEITVTIPVHDLDEVRDELYEVTILVDTTVDDSGAVLFELTTVLNTLRAAERAALDSVVVNLRTALPDGVPLYHAVVR